MSPIAGRHRTRIAVLSRSWAEPANEAGAAVRSVAGALSRHFGVDVLVPGPAGYREPDGAFERIGIGDGIGDGIAGGGADAHSAVLVDAGDASALELAAMHLPSAAVLVVGQCWGSRMEASGEREPRRSTTIGVALPDGGEERNDVLPVGLYVRVHPYAAERPHHELGGASGHLLVLSNRDPSHSTPQWPPGEVRWLLARFASQRVVVVENAVATLWRARSPVHRFGVHSRMDLWRLVAHAWVTVDLCPGPLFARECVESFRYGVPVVVPPGSPADILVEAGGGARFDSTAALLDAVDAYGTHDAREQAAACGRAMVDGWYGDPSAFVSRAAQAVDHATRTREVS